MAQARRLAPAFAFSTGIHAILFLFLVWGLWRTTAVSHTAPSPFDVVYFNRPGPSSNGGGTAGQAPFRKLLMPKGTPPPPAPVVAAPLAPPPPTDVIPLTNFADIMQSAGVGTVSLADRGTGGTGRDGPGTGPTGPGAGTGAPGKGDALYGLGDGIEGLAPLRKVSPKYTPEAMRAKTSGEVWLDAIVLKNGTVRVLGVTKSLDSVYGLDQAAIDAAKQWLFTPGTKNGQAVDVRVTLILEFRLH